MSTIYLDNAATTQPLPTLGAQFARYSDTSWYNPSALYGPALQVRREVESARSTLLQAYGSPVHRCLFTSGGTEGANMAVRFGARRRKGANYVCGGFEHPCVEESFRALAEAGEDVRFAKVQPDGSTRLEDVLQLVDSKTVLVSVMHVSNETGAVNDVSAIAKAVKRTAPKAVFHADGVQAFLRVPLRNPEAIDYYTVSAHKVHGLKGTGALFHGPDTPIKALMRGGGQENGLRSGTENVPGILCFAEAVTHYKNNAQQIDDRLRAVHAAFADEVLRDPSVSLLSPRQTGAPHIVALSVSGVRGETLMHSLERDGVLISVGSACSSRKGRGRAAAALGISETDAMSIVRVSFSMFTSEDDAREAAHRISEHAKRLRAATGN